MIGWHRPHDSAKILTHALHAPIPRRTARPASGFGSRGPARQAEEGGAGVSRGCRRSSRRRRRPSSSTIRSGLVRLLVRHERKHLRFRHGNRGRVVSGSRRAAGFHGRHGAAGGDARRRAARAAPQDAARRDGTRRKILCRHAGLAQRRQGARLSRRPRDHAGDAIAVSPRLCAAGSLCAEGASRRAGHFDRGHGGSGAAGRRATTFPCPTIASATA